jgi:hypothetical protein
MKCERCYEEFPQETMELSHDIPKYLGGMDCDGRHWLCIDCHNKYERLILGRCFILIFHLLLPYLEERGGYTRQMTMVKNSPLCRECFNLALQIKKEEWKNGDTEAITE